MKNGWLKNSITFLFLVLFLSMKIAGLHVLSHAEDKDDAIHCSVCDHAITHNLTPVLTSDSHTFAIEYAEFIFQNKVTENYNFTSLNNFPSSELFSRPPPYFL